MKKLKPTPAQTYAQNAIAALDAMIAAEPSCDYNLGDVAELLLQRPQTLRSALNAYLYKSQMAQQFRSL